MGFAGTSLSLQDASNLSSQAYLAENCCFRRDLKIAKARRDCGDDTEIGRRFIDFEPARERVILTASVYLHA